MPAQTPNPVSHTFPNPPPHVSSRTIHIAGILTTVFGLDELPASATTVTCLWLLHPRLQTSACMRPFADLAIADWNAKSSPRSTRGLIAVSFDARNHGSREVSPLANEAWRGGNATHALDMFSCYAGTARDVILLLDYLEAYVFPRGERRVRENVVFGISLGGHAAWQCVVHEPRVSAAVVCIGCPDYTWLMRDRARLSRLGSYKGDGGGFVGSVDFPPGLVDGVRRWDPAGLFSGAVEGGRLGQGHRVEIGEGEREVLGPLMARTLGGKRILNLSGGADKLVPYRCGEAFVMWLKQSVGKWGWCEDQGIVFKDIVFEGVGHECSPGMVKELLRFLQESREGANDVAVGKRSKMSNKL